MCIFVHNVRNFKKVNNTPKSVIDRFPILSAEGAATRNCLVIVVKVPGNLRRNIFYGQFFLKEGDFTIMLHPYLSLKDSYLKSYEDFKVVK